MLNQVARKLCLCLFFFTCFANAVAVSAVIEDPLPLLGANLEDTHQLRAVLPFTDLFKISQGWFTSCEYDWILKQPIDPGCTAQNSFNTQEQEKLKLDDYGWIKSLPGKEDPVIYTSVVSGMNLHKSFPLGRYVLLYSGAGEISVEGALNIVEQQDGRILFDLLGTKLGLKIKITQTKKYNYIRNIHLLAIENQDNYKDELFNRTYLKRLEPFEVIRFAGWSNLRLNEVRDWQDYPPPRYARYTSEKGVPVRTMIDLANTAEAAPWFNIPYKASDELIREYAYQARKHVRRGKKIFVELSNEMWNRVYPGARYAIAEGIKLWPKAYQDDAQDQRLIKLASNWYGKRSAEMCDIWQRVFSRYPGRVICVISSSSRAVWAGEEALDCPLWAEAPCANKIQAYAVDFWLADELVATRKPILEYAEMSNGLDKFLLDLEKMLNAEEDKERSSIQASKQLAQKYSLPLLSYEAGFADIDHGLSRTADKALMAFWQRANEDQRMIKLKHKLLKIWRKLGGETLILSN